jgi:hypothetical protein
VGTGFPPATRSHSEIPLTIAAAAVMFNAYVAQASVVD